MQRGLNSVSFQQDRLALARFEAWLGFVDNIDAAFAAHNAAIAVAALEGAKRVLDFHSLSPILGAQCAG